MKNYKETLEKRIKQYMKDYGITDADIKIGASGQMRGYVMGLKEALRLYEADNPDNRIEVDVSAQKETETRRTINTRRSRTNR